MSKFEKPLPKENGNTYNRHYYSTRDSTLKVNHCNVATCTSSGILPINANKVKT